MLSPFRAEAVADRTKRQQLDHLLQTTAPSERTVAGAVGLLLIGLAVWAIFGSVEVGVTRHGVFVGAAPARVKLLVPAHAAEHIRPGLEVRVEFRTGDGEVREVRGEVAAIAEDGVPSWLAGLEPAAADLHHRVDVALEGAVDLDVPNGTPCRVRIALGDRAPLALIDFGRS